MRVESSRVAYEVTHARSESVERTRSLRAWVGARPQTGPPAAARADRLEISTAAPPARPPPAAGEEESTEDPKLLALRLLIEALTGRRIRLLNVRELDGGTCAAPAPAEGAPDASRQNSQGFGIDYREIETRVSAEETRLHARTSVRTDDGREFRVDLRLEMSREFRETRSLRLALGDAVAATDPLVVNFGGGAARLTEGRFAFDLNLDGAAEQVPLLAYGSGLLVLDRNGNGAVDDGSELFGPRTGQGFAELSAEDRDGNGWIDEGDPLYAELRVWSPQSEGVGTLTTLAALGVGALSTGTAETPFELRSADNELLGRVRSSGLYLGTSGGAGTVQELDLVT